MSHRYRAYPTTAQAAQALRHAADARFVWNLGVEQLEFHDRYARRSFPPFVTSQVLAEAREGTWLGEGSSSVQQGAVRDFQQAMKNWRNPNTKHRRPTFRRKRLDEGFIVRDVTVAKLNRSWAQVQIPKHGSDRVTWVRFRLSRPLPANHGSARVTLDSAGRWHVSFNAEPKTLDREPTGRGVGIDRGVANTLATSDGEMAHAPTLTLGEQDEFLRRQFEFSACKRTDPMRDIHRQVIARTYVRLADRRRNWIEQSTSDLVRRYDLIAVEKLPVPNMVRRPKPKRDPDNPGRHLPNGAKAKEKLNRAISAQCWGLWLQRLKTKAALAGVEVIEVSARNTSRRCYLCGHVSAGNRESQAVFRCEVCGHEDHADTNAAKNILERARTGPEPLVRAA